MFSPDGTIVHTIPIAAGGTVANVTFGDSSRETLYIMAGNQVWRAEALAPGHVAGAQ